MISVALLFLWLKKILDTLDQVSALAEPLFDSSPLWELVFFWDALISKFINNYLRSLRKYSILQPVLRHEIKSQWHTDTATTKNFTVAVLSIPYKAGRCALSQPCCVLPKACVLPEAELFEGLEPLLFAMYKEYGKWINRLS